MFTLIYEMTEKPSYGATKMTDHEISKETIDLIAASTGVMSLLSWLPPLASLFTVIWLGIRIYESVTVQAYLNKRKKKRNKSKRGGKKK